MIPPDSTMAVLAWPWTGEWRSLFIHRWRQWTGVHPQWWVAALSLLAWCALALHEEAQPGAPSMPAWLSPLSLASLCGPGRRMAPWQAGTAPHTAIMIAAMMLPLVLPQARLIALASAWRRRHLAIGLFACAYIATWMAAWCAQAIAAAWGSQASLGTSAVKLPGMAMMTAALVFAAGWHVCGIRRRAMARCHRRWLLPMAAWPAALAATRQGAQLGVDCLLTCWPVMLASLYVPHGPMGLAGMAALAALAAWDRYASPASTRWMPLAWLLAAGCCAVASTW